MGVFDGIEHGIGHSVDKAGDWLEDKWDRGGKKAGEAVEWTTDHAAEVLDKAGAHSMARKVENLGDHVASDLGATVGEQELGRTEDPRQLVHGDTAKINATAKHLRSFHTSLDSVHGGLQKIRATGWKGEGSEAFTAKFVEHSQQWAHAADACETAAGALEAYAHTVEWAQRQAEEAIRLHKKGREANKKAVDDYNAKADAYNAKLDAHQDPGPRPSDPGKPGKADMAEAQRILTEARKQRNTAGAEAQAKVHAAVGQAPRKPAFTQRMNADALDLKDGGAIEYMHLAGGVVRSGTDMVKFARSLNPTDPYNITHPAEFLGTVSNAAAGILSLASHPERLPATLVGDGWGKDSSEAGGRLVGNVAMAFLSGGGSAGASAGERVAISAAKHGGEEAAEAGARKTAQNAGREGAESGAARGHVSDGPHGARDAGREEKAKCTDGTDPVDLATGRMFLPQTDVTLPGALPLHFHRRVQSGYRAGVWFGPSWSSTADQRLETDSEGVVFVGEDGMLLSYPHPAPGVAVLPTAGPRWPLTREANGSSAITDPLRGLTWHFMPYDDELALLEQISDRNGHWISFEYAADGTPLAIAHEAGYRIRITTDRGRITALHLVGGEPGGGGDAELIRYEYTDGNLTGVVNSSGEPLRFAYDDRGRVTSWTDRNGSRYDYTYDDRDRCVYESGVDGHMRCSIDYAEPDPATGLRVTTVTDALGHATRHVFNDALQLVGQTDPLGAVTRLCWDRHDRLLSRTDALGRTTEYRYDGEGRLTAVVRPDGREAQASHNALGLPETVTYPDGSVWRQTYDEAGRRTTVTDPAGAVTHYAYDDRGRPAAVTDALGNTTRLRCNAAGLVMEVTDPLGGVTSYRRDPWGRVTAVVDPLGATTRMKWSVEGRLLRRVAPDGAEESWTYDGEGNCTTHTDAIGGVTRYEYTHFDLLSARTGPDGVRHEFTHDAQLRLTRVTNPQGLTWSYAYDPAGHLASETDFDGRTLTYGRDAAGRLTARTNALGQTTTYEHDVLDRVVAKTADGAVTTYVHDAAGRLLEATGPDATLVHRRDRLGRIKSETTNGRTLTFTYDELGNRTRRITPSGAVSKWTYDAAGRPTSLTASGHTFDIEHDAAGREVARHFGANVTLRHAWDAAGRTTTQSLTAAGLTDPIQHRSYTYRRDSYLTSENDRHFELDAVGRVTSVDEPGWQERYAYDAAGNQTEASWPTAHPGAEAQGTRAYSGTLLKRAGTVRYEHDAQGRVVLRQKVRLSRKPDTWRYEWDAEDRLRAVTTPDGTRWRYLYDPLGRRIAKQRLTDTGEVAEQVDFTWDGPTLTEQTTVSRDFPNPVTLTWDHDGLRPVAQTERISAAEAPQEEIDSRFFAIVTDLVGTPSELVDESGTIAWHTRTTLWGTTTWARDSTAYTPLRFPGQYFDPETGLHYNFHRHYDPETGRYTSPDPLGLVAAPNPVGYVHNPHTWADPLGLSACPQNVALGIREEGLRDFADSNGFTHYLDDWQGFESQVRAAAHDPNVHLHIVMDGFSGSTPAERFMNAYKQGMGDNWFATEREMYHVGKAVRLQDRTWDSITFYENGKPVKVPEPDHWPRR
ncbi:putative T7SS-secreted protein [Streptomyces sp. NPDC001404]|uniref:putative T7SS-secreted protein n=1 Tax=Streptomyces sp. NPDC001404 TaxID=3364571 RepID=UPI0036949073